MASKKGGSSGEERTHVRARTRPGFGPTSLRMSLRWTRRPEGSTWGDFGPDDERGRLNLLTPEKVLQGVAEVRRA